MSRYSIVTSIIILSSIFGCSSKFSSVNFDVPKVLKSDLSEQNRQEDELAIFALDEENHRHYKKAEGYYSKLYNLTDKEFYAIKAIKNAVIAKDYKNVEDILDKLKDKKHKDPLIDSYLVAYYIDKKEYNKAKKLTSKLLEQNRNSKNLELAALVYEGLKQYQMAINYYQESYQKTKSQFALLKIADIYYIKLHNKSKAIRLLESDAAINGCYEPVCARLIQFYAYEKDFDGIANTLNKLYDKTKNPIYAQKLLQLYSKTNQDQKAIDFLKKTKIDDELLLDIYISQKDYYDAKILAEKLYKKSKKPILLAKSAILEYESSPNKKSKSLIKSVSKKFEQVVDILKDPLYYNYYGYILIDNDVDIKKGIKYIKRALDKEPNSLYYIDSLAWGYYKENECKKAYQTIKPFIGQSKESEIINHITKIKNCVKGQDK